MLSSLSLETKEELEDWERLADSLKVVIRTCVLAPYILLDIGLLANFFTAYFVSFFILFLAIGLLGM